MLQPWPNRLSRLLPSPPGAISGWALGLGFGAPPCSGPTTDMCRVVLIELSMWGTQNRRDKAEPVVSVGGCHRQNAVLHLLLQLTLEAIVNLRNRGLGGPGRSKPEDGSVRFDGI